MEASGTIRQVALKDQDIRKDLDKIKLLSVPSVKKRKTSLSIGKDRRKLTSTSLKKKDVGRREFKTLTYSQDQMIPLSKGRKSVLEKYDYPSIQMQTDPTDLDLECFQTFMDSLDLESDDLPFQVTSGLIHLGELGKHYCSSLKCHGIQVGGSRKKYSRLDEEGIWFCKTALLETTRHCKEFWSFQNLTYRAEFYKRSGDVIELQEKYVYVETDDARPSRKVKRPTEDKEIQCSLISAAPLVRLQPPSSAQSGT